VTILLRKAHFMTHATNSPGAPSSGPLGIMSGAIWGAPVILKVAASRFSGPFA
jgi:hypothetical protein